MSEARKVIIPKGTLDPNEHNVIEIPQACEESRILIARLTQQLKKPQGYYPPAANPYNRVERRYGDNVQFGMPPLSPVSEESSAYSASLGSYGRDITGSSGSYGRDTTGSTDSSGGSSCVARMGFCPGSTPIGSPGGVSGDSSGGYGYQTPPGSPMYYSPESTPSPPRRTPSPVRPAPSPPRRPSPKAASPPRRPPPPRQKTPPRRKSPTPDEDKSYSLSDVSDLMSDGSRAYSSKRDSIGCSPGPRVRRRSLNETPPPVSGVFSIQDLPEETSLLRSTMEDMDEKELEEMKEIQDRIKKFQKSRRDLFYSVMKIEGVDVPLD